MSAIPDTCPSCFSRIQPDAVFCSHCGSEVRRDGRVSVAQEGLRLDHLLRAHGALPIPQAESILQQVGQALAHLHGAPRSQVHGHVRPEAIRVEEGGRAILADPGPPPGDNWGGADMSTGLVLEDTEYMSPEECRGLPPTPASDQYALGAVAYAMIAGRPPFVGAFYRVLVAHLSERFAPLLQVRPDCPPRLASAVERMLSKDPATRWGTVAEAIEAALSGVETAEIPPGVIDLEPADAPSPSPSREAGTADHRGRPGKDPVIGVLGRGPDLGPPPAVAIEVEAEDVEAEDPGEDDRTLFFEPTSPPPDQEEWPDEPLEDPGPGTEVAVFAGGPPLPPAGEVLTRPEQAPSPVGWTPTPGRAPPPRPPLRHRPARRRRTTALLLLIVAGVGWGLWEWSDAPAGFEEQPLAQAPMDPRPGGVRDPGPDDRGGMLLPAPERVTGSTDSRPEQDVPPFPAARETIPPEGTSPPAQVQVQSPPPSTREATPDPPGAEAEPAPPSPTRPPPEEPAPAALGSLEMNVRPWAHVLVNGVPRGRFQTRVALELPAGTHVVRMSNPNFPPFDTTVVVQGGETTVLNKVLQPDSEP